MMRSCIFRTKPSRRETIWGAIYLGLYMLVLPLAVPLALIALFPDMNAVQINFVYFVLNFAATAVIFRTYLTQSISDAFLAGAATFRSALLGYVASILLTGMTVSAIISVYPEFISINDDAVTTLAEQNRLLMFVGAVFLAPVTEELLFRGLVFRGIYDRSPLAAHALTMVLFSLIHVSGYVGLYEAKLLFFCFLQYLPAAFCLNFAYQQSGTIISPILMHMATNLVAFLAMR